MAETDEQIDVRLTERFELMHTITQMALSGDARAVIISGPAGLGKSYDVEQALAGWGEEDRDYTIVKGYVRATGLYRTLYKFREPGNVIVMDDADSIFFDDVSLNLLKATCDTTERRVVSYLSETRMDGDDGEAIPRSFEFNGTIIFITNYDFDEVIAKGSKLAPHMNALMSRAHYIDLSMKTKRDYFVRIKQVIREGMLSDMTDDAKDDVVRYIELRMNNLRELSLRAAMKIAALKKSHPDKWRKMADITCCN